MAGDHADINKHVRLYIAVFAALAVLTVVTVAVARVHIPFPWNYVVGLGIAACKASLVAAIFMHLKWEKSATLWWCLGICIAFFIVLMALPTLTAADQPPRAQQGMWTPVEQPAAAADGAHGDH